MNSSKPILKVIEYKKDNDNIKHFRVLYIDLDLTDHSKSEVIY